MPKYTNHKPSSNTPLFEMDENHNKRKRSLEMTISSLPDDLWFKIFLRLPVENLLASKCVCKSWLSVISSPSFIRTHLKLSISSGEYDETLIVHHQLEGEDDNQELVGCGPFSLSHLASGNILEQLDFFYSEGDYLSKPILPCKILGSDCGIVCVLVEYGGEKDIYLWNPATKVSKLIAQGWHVKWEAIGFGFDLTDFDCKVVHIVSTSTCAEVFSSNRNAWRKIEPMPLDVPMIPDFYVCLHGFLLTTGRHGMMAFNLNKEVFIFNIKLPGDPVSTCITEYNGSVAASMFQKSENKVKLWTLDDEACLCGGGVEASWTMKLSCDIVGKPFDFVAGLFNSVEFLLVDSEADWFFYNPDKQATRARARRGRLPYCGILKHTKSLFPIAGSKPVKWTASPWRQQLELVKSMESDEESIPSDTD